MLRVIIILGVFVAFLPVMALAKRSDPPVVEPVVHEGIRYAAPNDDGRRGYIRASDAQTGKLLWELTIFRTFINPFMESDVQSVFISQMSIREGKLIIGAEDGRIYSVDPKTRDVKRMRK